MVEPDLRQGAAMKQPSAVGLPPTKWSVSPQPATVALNALTERADELTDDLIKAITGAPKLSDFAWIPAPTGPSVATASARWSRQWPTPPCSIRNPPCSQEPTRLGNGWRCRR